VARVKTDDEVRTWISTYREEHAEDDPAAAHCRFSSRALSGSSAAASSSTVSGFF